jgi:DNA-binding response OmpR family regulator
MRIMIVEDEPAIGMHLQAILREEGHAVEGPVASLVHAIDLAERSRPDLTVVDIGLQEGAVGVELARYLHGLCNTKFIYVTARPDAVVHVPGTLAVIPKPFTDRAIKEGAKAAEAAIRADTRDKNQTDNATL